MNLLMKRQILVTGGRYYWLNNPLISTETLKLL